MLAFKTPYQNIKNNIDFLRIHTALLFLFIGITSYATRVRLQENQIQFAVENSFIFIALILFPWSWEQLKQVIVVVGGLGIYVVLTTVLYYNTKQDWDISLWIYLAISKYLVVARMLSLSPLRQLYRYLQLSFLIILSSQIYWLHLHGTNLAGDGFNAQIGDRNYFSMLDIFFLASILTISKKMNLESYFDRLLIAILSIVPIIFVILSGSRSGIVSILFLMLIYYRWRGVMYLLLLAIAAYFMGLTKAFELRYINQFDAPIIVSEAPRLAMFPVFLEMFLLKPWGVITGFGLMASSHIDWLSAAYKSAGVQGPVHIQHNTLMDFIFSFGAIGFWMLFRLFKIIKNIPIFIFILLAGAFNNILAFFPLYIFLGIYLATINDGRVLVKAHD